MIDLTATEVILGYLGTPSAWQRNKLFALARDAIKHLNLEGEPNFRQIRRVLTKFFKDALYHIDMLKRATLDGYLTVIERQRKQCQQDGQLIEAAILGSLAIALEELYYDRQKDFVRDDVFPLL